MLASRKGGDMQAVALAVFSAVAGALAAATGIFAWRAQLLRRLLRQAEERAADLARRHQELRDEVNGRSRVQEERARFFDLSLDLLAIFGFDGAFEQMNPAWERVLGYPLAELKARRLIELVHLDDRASTQSEWQRLRLGGAAVDFENRYLGRDGTYRWLSWRAVGIPGRQRIYAIARDVSERKKLDQVKSDFVSVVSHELRTPLTSIRGSLGLLAGGVVGEIPERARELIEIAAKNSDRLVRLINDILDVEKVESGAMTFRFQLVELAALLTQAVEGYQAYAQPFDVRFALLEPLPAVRVRADPDRLLQVLANLLSNAAKYSPRGGTVEIALARRAGRAVVSVIDHGKGIPPEFQPRVFERFAQADATSTRQKGGTGLGLAISKAILERHGGQIGFVTSPGAGTTFSFELPEWGGDGPPVEPPPVAARPGARILHVEDDPDLRQVVAAIVEPEAAVERAGSLEEARSLLAEERFDLVILDLALPDGSGLELLPFLHGLIPPTPVVLFSVHEVSEEVSRQVAAVLVKSRTSNRQLLTAIRETLAAERGAEAGGPGGSGEDGAQLFEPEGRV
jgi:PAS domain S-box-containing protein